MGYVITYKGFRVECDTAAEAKALMAELGSEHAQLSRNSEQPWDMLAKALAVIQAAGAHGIQAADLGPAIGLPNGRAVGPKTRIWFRLLRQLGFKPDDVLISRRIGAKQRRWFAGKKITAALKAAHESAG